MVLCRIAAWVKRGGVVVGRVDGEPGLLFGGDGRSAVRFAEIAGPVCRVLGRASRRMGRISGIHSHAAVLHPCFPLGEAKSALARAEPVDRHLCIHRSDSSGTSCSDGIYHSLRLGRTVCRVCFDVGDTCPVKKSRGGECRRQPRNGGAHGGGAEAGGGIPRRGDGTWYGIRRAASV